MVAFPMVVLPMGWINSPPYFSAATETTADQMNRRLQRNQEEPPHRLEDIAIHTKPTVSHVPTSAAPTPVTLAVPATTPHHPHYKRPMKYADIYVDDFIAAKASVKKLKKGDGNWSTLKTVLGWVFDTLAQTITLPQRRQERLDAILANISPTQRRISVKLWHKFLGELRSMVIGIPGARGLFSTLQHAFQTESKKRLRLAKNEHHFINDFRTLAATLPNRLTQIVELVPRTPSVVGTTDAAGAGMGGIAFINTTDGVEAIVWRAPFDDDIQRRLVSFQNPTGDITNSDLELAATVTHHDVLTTHFDLREHTIQSSHDNTPAEAWQHEGSTTTLDRVLANAPRAARNAFYCDLRIIQQTVRRGVVKGTQQRTDAQWNLWLESCSELCIDPLLPYSDPVPFLQNFATQYQLHEGPSGDSVRAGTVSGAIRSVGQTMASMGSKDCRKDSTGALYFRLARMFRAYGRQDPPPNRVKPIPISLIRRIANLSADGSAKDKAVADMIIVAFFFLLRPGEYTGTENDDTPFRFQDIQLCIGQIVIPLLTSTDAQLWAATSVSLTFTTQKNGVRGEVVNHGLSGHNLLCPGRAVVRQIIHLRSHQATPGTILATYFHNNRTYKVQATDVTAVLRESARVLGPQYNFLEQDVSARSLRAGGAMALFNSHVDSNTIRLIGRWQSDAMLRYLHLQAQPVMQGFASRMLQDGDYVFVPNEVALAPMY
ncbi:unnamed protein product [Cylindrotheca closterium]|uniref:Uncharacterized protein n=1 Tax=Cylindrotheca closterium TaxID=2856 RepID=A0AAD2CXW1_9STRA|nr:unnamed protein product [Cylindrotheca closterium]